MDVLELTRALVALETPTGSEQPAIDLLDGVLRRAGYRTARQPVSPGRDNLYAYRERPVLVFSTHVDTVPPHLPLLEDGDAIRGRGACDAKGLAAAMVAAAERLADAGERRVGLLFVVGEENGSDGAKAAADFGPRGRFLINGEPTENRLSVGQKGTLRVDLTARGRAAHSAYPEAGVSAIAALLDTIERIRRLPLPRDPLLGESTLNLGLISGGVAPNVIPPHAGAQLLVRTVEPTERLKAAIREQLCTRCERRLSGGAAVPQGGRRAAGMGHYGRELRERPALPRLLGRGVPDGPGHHPRCPHRRGAHPEGRPAPGRGPLRPPGHRPPGTRGAMSAKIPVCILGATGTVGQKFVRLLADHPWFEVAAVAASSASEGRRYGDVVRWREQTHLSSKVADLTIQECAPPLPGAVAFSALDAEVAGPIEQAFARAGAFVVSNTRTHRMESDVPLLIPEANADHLVLIDRQRTERGWSGAILANPNCSTAALALALAPLHQAFGVEKLFVSTMQAVSGAGYPGVASLDVLGNVIPHIGGEEEKIEGESRKILGTLGPAGVEPAPFRGERAHQPGGGG